MTTSTQAGIAAVQMMMQRFGLTADDLATGASNQSDRLAPTFAEFIPTVIDRMPAGRTRDHYGTYWNKILTQPGWGERRLDEPTPADLQVLCEQIRAARVIRSSDRGGNEVVRLHTETACRRAGALALRPQDLDPVQSVILLREKGGTRLWQPISPTLMQALCRHAEQRGAPASGPLLRTRNGTPISRRRYNHLFERLGKHLPWVLTHGISIHWLPHATITWVERHYGTAVAREIARHSNTGGGVTGICTLEPDYPALQQSRNLRFEDPAKPGRQRWKIELAIAWLSGIGD